MALGGVAVTGRTAGWIAALATLTAAVAAYLHASRYQYLIVSYQAAAQLRALKTRWLILADRVGGAAVRDLLSRAFEDAISVENSAWMAKWLEEENTAPPNAAPVAEPAVRG